MTRDRRISELEREAAQPGRFDRELVEAYKRANPRRETSFSDWVNLFKGSGRRPAEEEDSWSKDLNRLMKDLGYSSIPPNEAARPNVRKDALDTISRLNALAEPYRKIRSEYEEEQLKKWNEDRGDFERLPERNMMTSHPGEIEKYRKGILREEIPGGEKFTMPPLRIEGDIYKPVAPETEPPKFVRLPGRDMMTSHPAEQDIPLVFKPSKKKEPKKDPWFKHGPAPDLTGLENFWPRLWDKIKPDFDTEEWEEAAGNFGKGLAALGDAFMAGGGMKSNFLQNISKAEQRREKQPFERFKVFSKLLQSEVNQEMINAYRMAGLTQRGAEFQQNIEQQEKNRKARTADNIRNYNMALQKMQSDEKWKLLTYGTQKERLELQRKELALKNETNKERKRKLRLEIENLLLGQAKAVRGGPLVNELRPIIKNDTTHQIFPKWLHDQEKDDKKILRYSAKDLEEIGEDHRKNLQKLAGKKASATTQEILARHENDPESVAILRDAFKRNWRNQTPTALSGIDKFINTQKKAIDTVVKREAEPVKYAQAIISSTNKILKIIGEEVGDPSLARDQIEVERGSGKIFYTPRDEDGRLDRANRKEVDLDGVQLPGGISLASTLDIFGTSTASALEQLYEGIYAPKRRQDFGASQSFRELERYKLGVGEEIGFIKREGGMLGYILGMADRAQQGLTKYSNEMRNIRGGRHRLSLDGFDYNSYYNPELKRYTPQFSSPESAAKAARRIYKENEVDEAGNVDPKYMPGWYRSTKNRINQSHKDGATIFFHYPRFERVAPDGKRIIEESQSPRKNTFSRYQHGTGKPPSEWNDGAWIKFIEQYGINPKNWDF